MRICWPSEINSEAKDLIGKILKYNPEDRLNVKEILGHSFIKKYFPNAVNELILPNERLKYNVFVVSVDDPKKWNPLIIDEETNSYNNKCFPNNNEKRVKRTYTVNYKINLDLSKYKYEKKNSNMNINKENNINSINAYNYKYSKINKQNNNNFSKYEHNNLSSNYNTNTSYTKYNKYVGKDKYEKFDKFEALLNKYENMKKDFDTLKKNYITETEKLKGELREKENKISQFIKEGKLYYFSEREYRRKKRELKELEVIYEDLKAENDELKERIQKYKQYIKEKKKIYYENNFDEVRNSINGNNKNNFQNAMNKLKYNIDEETHKNFDIIIKEKEKQLEKYKEEEKERRMKEREQFSLLINKYDRALSCQEKENKGLKVRLKELESNLYNI